MLLNLERINREQCWLRISALKVIRGSWKYIVAIYITMRR